METLREQLKKQKWAIGVFLGILVVGIFLRTYEFHDFLRFNADQSRDAGVVSDYLTGESPLPLLGPKAGGTDFRVGPIFYHFQILSGSIFGNEPDAMAYPDLFFSILAIPLLFLFLRKYFDVKTSILLVVLFAVSFYAVKYSRFAWNPNSLPFWSLLFLYALHTVAVNGTSVKKYWLVLLGVALGIGAQLHTLSLIFFPIVTVFIFIFLFIEKRISWKNIFFVVAIALCINTPQIVSEIRENFANTGAFLQSIGAKEKKGNGIVNNILKDMVCHTQANVYILSSYDSDDGCGLSSVKKGMNLPVFFFGLVFFIGGIWLASRAFRREMDISRKYFLGIVFFYLGLSFVILIPLANEVSMRFFLAMIFMPFLFLGLWIEYVRERCPKYAEYVVMSLISILVILNLHASWQSLMTSKSYLVDSNAGMDNVMLREVEISASFIIAHAGDAKIIAVDGDAQYLFKALKSMNYFTSREGIKLVQKNKKTDLNIPVFLVENTKQKEKILINQNAVDSFTFGRFTIFSFKR